MKGRQGKSTGGTNDAEEDVKTKPMRYTADSNVNSEAEERKRGGKAAKCGGGSMRKEGGKVDGKADKARADRKPRQSGGRANATDNPFSSARRGTEPSGHKTEVMD